MKIIVLLMLLITACDFKTPTDNGLVDLNTAVNFFDVAKVRTSLYRFPEQTDITNSADWNITGDVFEVSLATEILAIDSNTYITNISYDIYMETDRYFSLIGVDSLVQNLDMELINSNSHYDTTDRLELVISQLQYRTKSDDEYQNVPSLDSLRNIDLEMKFRYFFRVTSGYNYPYGEIPSATFYLNLARYRIHLKLLGYYL
ncbi:MAG: hypothetical protein KDD94_05275 [Calditrichaeota bacterium]|nr:hypothetical protein [Calditrichota bacterium]